MLHEHDFKARPVFVCCGMLINAVGWCLVTHQTAPPPINANHESNVRLLSFSLSLLSIIYFYFWVLFFLVNFSYFIILGWEELTKVKILINLKNIHKTIFNKNEQFFFLLFFSLMDFFWIRSKFLYFPIPRKKITEKL